MSFITNIYLICCLLLDSQCITVGGNDSGVSCKFPFKYDIWDDVPYAPATIMRWPWFHKQMVFENCTNYRKSGSRPWCATKVSSNNRYISGYWGECPDTLGCNLVEGMNGTCMFMRNPFDLQDVN